MGVIDIPITFNKFQVWYTSRGCYYYRTTCKNDDPKCAHIHSQRGKLSLEGTQKTGSLTQRVWGLTLGYAE